MNKLLKVTLITAIMATSGMCGGDGNPYASYMYSPFTTMPIWDSYDDCNLLSCKRVTTVGLFGLAAYGTYKLTTIELDEAKIKAFMHKKLHEVVEVANYQEITEAFIKFIDSGISNDQQSNGTYLSKIRDAIYSKVGISLSLVWPAGATTDNNDIVKAISGILDTVASNIKTGIINKIDNTKVKELVGNILTKVEEPAINAAYGAFENYVDSANPLIGTAIKLYVKYGIDDVSSED